MPKDKADRVRTSDSAPTTATSTTLNAQAADNRRSTKKMKSGADQKREIPSITIARKDIDVFGEDKYGHWWTEIDNKKESYGWWPKYPVGLKETLGGTAGELNGQTSFGGTSTLDPHHLDRSSGVNLFSVYTKDKDKDPDQFHAEVRNFANSYSGEWRWTFGAGQNCHTFQKALISKLNVDIEKR